MRLALILTHIVAFFFVSIPAHAEKVGTVRLVEIYGYGTLVGAKRQPLFARDDVILNMEIESVEDGRIDVRFKDNTRLIVGSLGKVKIDNFAFNSKSSTGDLSLNIATGLMRFVTGKMASKSYAVRTPSAVLGVRGTDFIVSIDASGSTLVSVLSGIVEVTPTNGSPSLVSAGSTAETDGKQISIIPTRGLPEIAETTFGVSSEANDSGGGNDSGAGGGDGGGH